MVLAGEVVVVAWGLDGCCVAVDVPFACLAVVAAKERLQFYVTTDTVFVTAGKPDHRKFDFTEHYH